MSQTDGSLPSAETATPGRDNQGMYRFEISGVFEAENDEHALRNLDVLVGLLQDADVAYKYNLQATATRTESLPDMKGERAEVIDEG
jgi:hypothetical protein